METDLFADLDELLFKKKSEKTSNFQRNLDLLSLDLKKNTNRQGHTFLVFNFFSGIRTRDSMFLSSRRSDLIL
jgi:hypothetical protein